MIEIVLKNEIKDGWHIAVEMVEVWIHCDDFCGALSCTPPFSTGF
jgi:hypothetical protein